MEYFINADTGDNGTGDGSEGNPWETLAYAFDQTSADDTIICQDSIATYAFATDIFGHAITIQGEKDDASGAVFDGAGGLASWRFDADSTIKKLTIQNALLPKDGNAVRASGASVDLIIENCILKQLYHYFNPSWSGTAGILGGVSVGGSLTVENCLIYDCGQTSVPTHNIALISTYNSANFTITVTGTTVGLEVPGVNLRLDVIWHGTAMVGATFTVKNSIFYAATAFTVGTSLTAATYSDFHNITGSPSGTGVITSDPLLVDSPNGNLRLRPASPCISTGSLI